MGMFDYVKFELTCEVCGHLVDEFQTKDLECELKTLKPLQVDSFYGSCKQCHAWYDFARMGVDKPEYGSMDDFRKEVTPHKRII